jgi:UDP-GlcNAc:undecaprenyl-phosphate/decaprenyl-phosphate GlcNAc-1-phosphate transferase
LRIYLFLALVAAAVTYLATPGARLLARRIGAMTAVRERDVHTAVTPRLGGAAMWIGIVSALLVASRTPFLGGLFDGGREMLAVMAAATLVVILGAADDLWDLDWVTKLAGQVLAAFVLAWQGVQLTTLPLNGVTILSPRTSLILTVLVVVVVMNAVNFIDGLDGLAAGVVAIGGLAFAGYSYLLTRSTSSGDYSSTATLLVIVMVGACVGFLAHNFHPARIFMGDSGSMLLGLMLAAGTITVTGQVDPVQLRTGDLVAQLLPIFLPIAVMIYPIADFGLAVVRRMANGRAPFRADKRHLHHRMLDLGHDQTTAVLVFYAWTAVIAFGMLMPALLPERTSLLVLAAGLVAVSVLTILPRLRGRIPTPTPRGDQ